MSQIYYQIEKAINCMAIESQRSPSVERLAEIANLETHVFRRVFNQWSGVDPETFSQYLSPRLKRRTDSNAPDLFDAAGEKQSSNKKRLHGSILNIIKMGAEDTKNDGESLLIKYSVQHSPFGRMMVASTGKGVCKVSFLSKEEQPDDSLKNEFARADIRHQETPEHITLSSLFRETNLSEANIDLHVKGTPFQISVWESLLQIPEGELSCCSDIAKEIDNPKAVRAVGSAIGSNPIAFFIPCHRVVPAAGGIGKYRWGETRKAAIIGWEMAKIATQSECQVK